MSLSPIPSPLKHFRLLMVTVLSVALVTATLAVVLNEGPSLEVLWVGGHPTFGFASSYSPTLSGDGLYFAVTYATTRQTVAIFRVEDGQLLQTIDADAAVTGVAWSPTRDLIAGVSPSVPGGGGWTRLYLWDTSGVLLQNVDVEGSLSLWPSVAWSPDGAFLAVFGQAKSDQLRIFRFEPDKATLTPQITISLQYDLVGYHALAWSPDGRFASLVAAALPGRQGQAVRGLLFTWAVPDFELVEEREVPTTGPWQPLYWSPNGERFALLVQGSPDDVALQIVVPRQPSTTLLQMPPGSSSVAWTSSGSILVGTYSGHLVVANENGVKADIEVTSSRIIYVLPARNGYVVLVTLENGLIITRLL